MTDSGPVPTTDGDSDAIEVLLVDDNEQWAQFMASDLQQDRPLRVTVALDANEALLALQDDESIECVVTDYRMPEIDGIQLLERVRRNRPDLPFILLTGAGSEDVASRAIKAGVSDYFQKDPRVDQTTVLANRIRQAVEQYRLRNAVVASEKRYRTITEQIWDAIVIVQDGRIRFCNERLVELTGYSAAALSGMSFVEGLIPEHDRTRVRETIESVLRGDVENPLQETQLHTKHGAIRDCEYTIRTVPFEDDVAAIASIRDVTEKKARERNLRREREINRTVQRTLVGSRTREELEAEIVRVLSASGYDLVWIGEPIGSSIRSRAKSGRTSYLEAIDLSSDDSNHTHEPGVWALRSREPQFVDDFAEMFSTEWQSVALEAGFRSGAALPLAYDGVLYGFVALYHGTPHRIDEDERTLLLELADTIGFSIHHLETEKALHADHTVDVELELTVGHYLSDVASDAAFDAGVVEFTVEGTHPAGDDDTIQYVSIDDVPLEVALDVLGDHPAVRECNVVRDSGPARVQLLVSEPVPERTLLKHRGTVRSTTVVPGRSILRFELASRRALSGIVAALEAAFGTVTLRSCVESERQETTTGFRALLDAAGLTDKQAAALSAAYHHGYYEQPRHRSATDVADSLGITHSTYLQHLRAAQRKVFGSLYE
ncbi:MAG: PAS domain S-box protein [Halobacteriota archaeon]